MISENLKKLRKLHKLSQEDVAEKIQVSRQAVAKWEAGETMPDLYKCDALAKLYNVSVDDLIHYKEGDNYNIALPPKGKYVFGTVTVGERGQIVIPKKARTIFDIKAGDDLIVFGDEEQGIALMKADKMLEFINLIQQNPPNEQ